MTEITGTAAAVAAPARNDTPAPRFEFSGRRAPLFRLLARNLLLTVVSLGIYRFWAKTRVRRYFWRNTRLLGEPFEYVGTGGELFVGFLIAIVVLVPIGGVYSLLKFFTVGMTGYLPFAVDIVYYALLVFLIQIAIHRMRRYRLTRTVWRGIRFGLDGSSLRYALISSGYGFLSAITLGLARPWHRVATLRYFFGHARFGTVPLALEARPGWLFRRWLIVLAPVFAALILFVALNTASFSGLIDLIANGLQTPIQKAAFAGVIGSFKPWPLYIAAISYFLLLWYAVVEFRYFSGCLTLGRLGFRSSLSAGIVYAVHALYWFLVLVTGGLLIAAFVSIVSPDGPNPRGIFNFIAFAGFFAVIAFFMIAGIIRTVLVDVTLLRRACATLEVSNADALDAVVQSSATMPGHGEGLADALDVGGF